MKAVVYTEYGPADVLKIEEIEQPPPQDQQVLIKVHAASINASDWRVMENPILARLTGGGLLKPKNTRVGSDVAGQVEAVGENVKQFRPGDEVFGCAKGAFAENVLAREGNLALKPANRTYQEAAAIPIAALTALQGIRYGGGIRPGQKVLIQGASGGVGTFAVQLTRLYGAEVIAVCSTRNLDMARSLGAGHVIDYTKEDFTRSSQGYDFIFAINGYHSLSAYQRALNPGGVYVCAGGSLSQIFQVMLLGSWMSRSGDKKMGMMGIAKINQDDLVYLGELLETGKIISVIDRSYPLSKIVEAFRYIEETHPQGKVVITVES
ncbi:MAG: NAD(P)-dependent alcohol dehydrogenase [Omnitrophica WOR_2 bacterium]